MARPPSSPLVLFQLFLVVSAPFLRPAAAGQPINVIVVLVMENRSFDHMLGWMKKDLNATFDGLTGTECNHRSTKDPASPTICVSDDVQYVDPNPGHSFENIRDQVFGVDAPPGAPATMAGFVEQAASMSEDLANTVMKGFKPSNVPVLTALAQEFAVFDRWFPSIPGPTQPNRLFVYSGTSHGATSHVPKDLIEGFPQRTIFENLLDDGLDFGIYFESLPTTLFYRNLRSLKYAFKFHNFGTFEKHASEGRLPQLTVLEPRYFDMSGNQANDDHPSHDVANGQKFIKFVYETLRASPQWNEMLFLITYDEHGGFYDHVPTPTVGVPNPDGILGPPPANFNFDRLGVRVPTIAISPWIKKGTVVGTPDGPTPTSQYEHSSIPATIKKMFNLTSGFLTARDAWAGTFDGVIGELTEPRKDCPETLPDVAPLRVTQVDENRRISDFQSEVVQLASVLNGDYRRQEFSDESIRRMTIKEANAYVERAVDKFLQTNRRAFMKGRRF